MRASDELLFWGKEIVFILKVKGAKQTVGRISDGIWSWQKFWKVGLKVLCKRLSNLMDIHHSSYILFFLISLFFNCMEGEFYSFHSFFLSVLQVSFIYGTYNVLNSPTHSLCLLFISPLLCHIKSSKLCGHDLAFLECRLWVFHGLIPRLSSCCRKRFVYLFTNVWVCWRYCWVIAW